MCVLGVELKLNPAPQNKSYWLEGLLLVRRRNAGEFSWHFSFVTQSGTVPNSQQQNKDTSPVPLPHGTPRSRKARARESWSCSNSVNTEPKQTPSDCRPQVPPGRGTSQCDCHSMVPKPLLGSGKHEDLSLDSQNSHKSQARG